MKETRRGHYWNMLGFIGPAVLPPRREINAATRKILSQYWSLIVRNYPNRKLTRDSDKLVALSGVCVC